MFTTEYRGVIYNNRDAAAAMGETLYLGRICRRGHENAMRYVSTGQCTVCLREDNKRRAAQVRHNRNMAYRGAKTFSYALHPDDHAAALAYCQALDIARGRDPQVPAVVQSPPPMRVATLEQVQRDRERILGAHVVKAENHMPAEMMCALGVNIPTNGS
jgi:hypothetical protein